MSRGRETHSIASKNEEQRKWFIAYIDYLVNMPGNSRPPFDPNFHGNTLTQALLEPILFVSKKKKAVYALIQMDIKGLKLATGFFPMLRTLG